MKDLNISSIAKELGYSTATISRVVNNKKGVGEKTREQILDAIGKMGYRPNRIAQSLAQKRSKIIGVIVPDFANDFLGSIVNTIEQTLESLGYRILLFSTNWNIDSEKEKIQLAIESQVDGIILKPTSTKAKHFNNLPVPVVLVSQTYNNSISWVDIDNKEAGLIGTEHLIVCGYKKIAFIGETPSNLIYTKRYEGYKKALEQHGLEPLKPFYCKNSIDAGYDLINSLHESNNLPDAVFCSDDNNAIGLMAWALDHKISIPDDLGIVGFNNSTMSKLPQINLTTISQPKEQIGRYAVQSLIDIINYLPKKAMPQRIVLSPNLIKRATTREI